MRNSDVEILTTKKEINKKTGLKWHISMVNKTAYTVDNFVTYKNINEESAPCRNSPYYFYFYSAGSFQESARLLCRYCSKTSNNDNLMMHRIYKRRWYNRRPFAARVRILNAATGVINYLTRTFSNKNGPIILSEMLETHNTKYR